MDQYSSGGRDGGCRVGGMAGIVGPVAAARASGAGDNRVFPPYRGRARADPVG